MDNPKKFKSHSEQQPVAIHAINAYSNVFVEATAEELGLTDIEIKALLLDMCQDVTNILEMRGVKYSDLKWALTPRSNRHEIAFVFDSCKATSPFYGEEFSEIWLAAMQVAGGPKRTAILEGDIIGPQLDAFWKIIDERLKVDTSQDAQLPRTEQYFVVYFTNVSKAQLEVLDRQMRIKSEAYLGYVDCSCWTPFKTALLLPQVALRIDNQIITNEDEDGNANLRGYPFEDFGFKVIGVDEISYGTMLEFRIDIGASSWSSRDTSVSIGALSGVIRDISSMDLEINEARFEYLTSERPGWGHGASILKAGLAGLDRYELAKAIKEELNKGLLYNLRLVKGSRTVLDEEVAEPKNDAIMFSVQVEFPDIANTQQRYQVAIKYDTTKHRGEVVTMYG
jgi:hypothetical protein